MVFRANRCCAGSGQSRLAASIASSGGTNINVTYAVYFWVANSTLSSFDLLYFQGNAQGGITCNLAAFNNVDPEPGHGKACYIVAAYQEQGAEWTTLPLSFGSGVFGMNSTFVPIKAPANGFACSIDNFGDPALGAGKACYVQTATLGKGL